jgi:hypothetical protein
MPACNWSVGITLGHADGAAVWDDVFDAAEVAGAAETTPNTIAAHATSALARRFLLRVLILTLPPH